MTQSLKNVAASVRQRLQNYARTHGDVFQNVLTRYALERLLYRLSQSPYEPRFLLKGALLFLLWSDNPHRATRDIDLLSSGSPSVEGLGEVFRSLCELEVEADGLMFLTETLSAEAIREDNIYGGVRITLIAQLDSARIPVQVDVGFGDSITPEPQEADFPTLLDLPAPKLRVYQRETVIAEKLQALVMLGLANSRMKDYLDLYALGKQFAFDGARLGETITATFVRRETPLPTETPAGLTDAFIEDIQKRMQWNAFIRRQPHAETLPSLEEAVAFISEFLLTVLRTLSTEESMRGFWPAGGPWQPEADAKPFNQIKKQEGIP